MVLFFGLVFPLLLPPWKIFCRRLWARQCPKCPTGCYDRCNILPYKQHKDRNCSFIYLFIYLFIMHLENIF